MPKPIDEQFYTVYITAIMRRKERNGLYNLMRTAHPSKWNHGYIPIFLVKQWRLKAGDKLDWSLEARKNEITIVVRKVESSKKK